MKYYTKLFKRYKGIINKWQQIKILKAYYGEKFKEHYFKNQYKKSVQLLIKQRKDQFGI